MLVKLSASRSRTALELHVAHARERLDVNLLRRDLAQVEHDLIRDKIDVRRGDGDARDGDELHLRVQRLE